MRRLAIGSLLLALLAAYMLQWGAFGTAGGMMSRGTATPGLRLEAAFVVFCTSPNQRHLGCDRDHGAAVWTTSRPDGHGHCWCRSQLAVVASRTAKADGAVEVLGPSTVWPNLAFHRTRVLRPSVGGVGTRRLT